MWVVQFSLRFVEKRTQATVFSTLSGRKKSFFNLFSHMRRSERCTIFIYCSTNGFRWFKCVGLLGLIGSKIALRHVFDRVTFYLKKTIHNTCPCERVCRHLSVKHFVMILFVFFPFLKYELNAKFNANHLSADSNGLKRTLFFELCTIISCFAQHFLRVFKAHLRTPRKSSVSHFFPQMCIKHRWQIEKRQGRTRELFVFGEGF